MPCIRIALRGTWAKGLLSAYYLEWHPSSLNSLAELAPMFIVADAIGEPLLYCALGGVYWKAGVARCLVSQT